jgi:hypothetical protein
LVGAQCADARICFREKTKAAGINEKYQVGSNALRCVNIFFLYARTRLIASHSYPTMDSLRRTRGENPMSERLFRILAAALNTWRTLLPKHPPHYRPEAHYMRGPGPKWRAKHAPISLQR